MRKIKNNFKIKTWHILLIVLFITIIIFYPYKKIVFKGITESKIPYVLEKEYNITEIYYENIKYYETECTKYYNHMQDVYIPSRDYYDYIYENCYSKTPSHEYRSITINNSGDIDLIYPILVEYYPVPTCGQMIFYSEPAAIRPYGEFEVKAGQTYKGSLSYYRVYEIRSNSITAKGFSFGIDAPKSCKEVEKVKAEEKTKIINIVKNETMYNITFMEENLTIKVSIFRKWIHKENITNYGCPFPYVIINETCYRQI